MRCTMHVQNALKLRLRTIRRTCVCGFVTTVLVSTLRLSRPAANPATGGCEECWNAPRKSGGEFEMFSLNHPFRHRPPDQFNSSIYPSLLTCNVYYESSDSRPVPTKNRPTELGDC